MTERGQEEVRHILANATADEPPLLLDMDALVGRARRERRRRRTLLGTVAATAVIAVSGTLLPALLSPSPPLPPPGPAGPPAAPPTAPTATPDPVEPEPADRESAEGRAAVPESVPGLWPAPAPVDYDRDAYAAVTAYATHRLASVPDVDGEGDGDGEGFSLGALTERSAYPGPGQEVFSWHFTAALRTAEGEFTLDIRLDSHSSGFPEPLSCAPGTSKDGPCRVEEPPAHSLADPTADGGRAEPSSRMESVGAVSTLELRLSDFQSVTVTVTGDKWTPAPLTEGQMDDIARRLIA
ncbi:hypothetical protein ACFVUW_15825 [Streptomyces xiamenensis]|uniref:hypothetical protein n=1 Tax=Streptomyces xiamenensis TaxID=408015 RepID=UPI0036E48E19